MFTHTNGVAVSPLVLGIALQDSKILAIRQLREDAPQFVGLKDAKDAVEAAMAQYDTTQIERLQEWRRYDAEAMARLRDDLASARKALESVALRAQRYEDAISDHVFGRRPLPNLVAGRDDVDYADEPF